MQAEFFLLFYCKINILLQINACFWTGLAQRRVRALVDIVRHFRRLQRPLHRHQQPDRRSSGLPSGSGPSAGHLGAILEEEAEPTGQGSCPRQQPGNVKRRQPLLHVRLGIPKEVSLTHCPLKTTN